MKTDDLIAALSADLSTTEPATPRLLLPALGVAMVAAAVFLLATIGVRDDLAAALETVRFPLKFVVTLTLAAAAFPVVLRAARPIEPKRLAFLPLLAPVAVIGVFCTGELVMLPPSAWGAAAHGVNGSYCLVFVPTLSLMPLAATLLALRRAAPASPTFAGAVAGLLSAGLGATIYAVHCTDDSPLFLASGTAWRP